MRILSYTFRFAQKSALNTSHLISLKTCCYRLLTKTIKRSYNWQAINLIMIKVLFIRVNILMSQFTTVLKDASLLFSSKFKNNSVIMQIIASSSSSHKICFKTFSQLVCSVVIQTRLFKEELLVHSLLKNWLWRFLKILSNSFKGSII